MVYIITRNISVKFGAGGRKFSLDPNDLGNLISDNILLMIDTDEKRDNEFINKYNISVLHCEAPDKFNNGDQIVCLDNDNLKMVIIN